MRDLVRNTPPQEIAEALRDLAGQRAAEVLAALDQVQASRVVERLPREQAGELLASLPADAAAGIVGSLDRSRAVDVLRGVANDKLAAIVERLAASRAAEVITDLPSEKAREAVAGLGPRKAVEVLRDVADRKAAEVIEGLGSERSADVLRGLPPGKAGAVVGEMPTTAAADALGVAGASVTADVLANAPRSRAGKVLDRLDTSLVEGVVRGMAQERLHERLSEMSPAKLSELPLGLLLNVLPGVPADVLSRAAKPAVPTDLPRARAVATTSSDTSFELPRSRRGEWAELASPGAFVQQVLGRFASDAADVRTTLTPLDTHPSRAPGFPPGQVARHYFELSVQAGATGSVDGGYFTFALDREWLEGNGFHKWSVTLHRLNPVTERWQNYIARKVDETESEVIYESSTPGFSIFAITASRTVAAPAVTVKSLTTRPPTARAGEPVTVRAEVTNATGAAVEFPAQLFVDDQFQQTTLVTVEPGATATASFVLERAVGRYALRLDRLTATLEVLAAEVAAAVVPAAPSGGAPGGGTLLYALVGVAAVLAFAGGAFALQRRGKPV